MAHGIRLSAVSPGPVSTDLWLGENGVIEAVAANGVDACISRRSILDRIGFAHPEDVAALVVFLASPRAANITGVNYLIDRGRLTPGPHEGLQRVR